jgi:superfamily II DNA or RNA helicase
MSSDLTFFTNEDEKHSLLKRFQDVIESTEQFDCIVGYFYLSGFHQVYKQLEKVDKIRILVGISTESDVLKYINKAEDNDKLSGYETREKVKDKVIQELENIDENIEAEEGIIKFIEWIRSGKLEIKAHPSQRLHAKVYIYSTRGSIDDGRVITGSSNFTKSGFEDSLEFNVELKRSEDHEFALKHFNKLWAESEDVSDKYVQTIKKHTWLNDEITPYQLYIKFLYEYFKEELQQDSELAFKYLPDEFKTLRYQEQAVLNAKKILEEYGGVFISDVVGLGKTYISAMLASQLDGRTLVIAPPALLDRENRGSWPRVFSDFNIPLQSWSTGSLEKLEKSPSLHKYKNIIIDEAHKFRNESTKTYERLHNICRNKRVILVTATPYNNSPKDILSQIKLFQNPSNSDIPNLKNIEGFFNERERMIKSIKRKDSPEEFLEMNRNVGIEVRDRVLRYLMVRRTRTEIAKYYADDLASQGLKFPNVDKPRPVYYKMDQQMGGIFNRTIELIKKFHYARYRPLWYLKGNLSTFEKMSQDNMGKFMKILLVKRLESSFTAFQKTLERFIRSYRKFQSEYEKGNVYVSKKYSKKIYELLDDEDNYEEIDRLLEEDQANKYAADDFNSDFAKHIEEDLENLITMKQLWSTVFEDPKLNAFVDKLKNSEVLKKSHLIVFTESKETAEYLEKSLEMHFKGEVLCFSGGSNESIRQEVLENFDAKVEMENQKNDKRILISTEVLSEGVNLHRANVVINYDIPWNPTRMMQRVGRINRVDTKFDKIYTYNFFPSEESEKEINLQSAAEGKIGAFLELLGGDSLLLTEGEPLNSHELFSRLMSKETITGEEQSDDSELKYFRIIEDIYNDHNEELEEIIKLPKKSRTAREHSKHKGSLLTFFRRGRLHKFFKSNSPEETKEIDFITAAEILEAKKETKKHNIGKDFYDLLTSNRDAFNEATQDDEDAFNASKGRDNARRIYSVLKASYKLNSKKLTDDVEIYYQLILKRLIDRDIPKNATKTLFSKIEALGEQQRDFKKVLDVIKTKYKLSDLIEDKHANGRKGHKREVILSEYLT